MHILIGLIFAASIVIVPALYTYMREPRSLRDFHREYPPAKASRSG